MKNVIAYCRVSTDNQAKEDKFGIETQKKQIQEYCDKNDMNIAMWRIDEGISGAKEERPEFDKILFSDEVTNPPIEFIVVATNDRIARDINIYFYYKMLLSKKNIKLISVTEDFGTYGPFASVLEAFTLCIAEMERDKITKRTSGGRKTKSAIGGYSGGRSPIGYKIKNSELIINEDEAKYVREIFKLRANNKSLSEIAKTITANGYITRSGKSIDASGIRSILNNIKTYQGLYKYGNGEWVKGKHTPILE